MNERSTSCFLCVYFFFSFCSEHQYEVRLWRGGLSNSSSSTSNSTGNSIHSANSSDCEHIVNVAIHTKLNFRSPILVFSSDSREFPIPGVNTRFKGMTYINGECDTFQFITDALALLSECRLRVLMSRLLHSMSLLPSSLTTVRLTLMFYCTLFYLFITLFMGFYF